jgi:hypothetical protein
VPALLSCSAVGWGISEITVYELSSASGSSSDQDPSEFSVANESEVVTILYPPKRTSVRAFRISNRCLTVRVSMPGAISSPSSNSGSVVSIQRAPSK